MTYDVKKREELVNAVLGVFQHPRKILSSGQLVKMIPDVEAAIDEVLGEAKVKKTKVKKLESSVPVEASKGEEE